MKTPESRGNVIILFLPLTVAGQRGGFVTLCTFYMQLESVHLKLFHEGFSTFNI